MRNVSFQPIMFAYAAESTYKYYDAYPSHIKVYMPDMFPDKKQGVAVDYKTNNGSAKNIIVNVKTPSISNFLNNRNYLNLPVMGNMHVTLNEKLIVGFVNSNPRNGIILGKAKKDGI